MVNHNAGLRVLKCVGKCVVKLGGAQNRSGIGFLWQNLQFQFTGIPQIFGNATKDRSIYQNRIDKALREWYCNHILREGMWTG